MNRLILCMLAVVAMSEASSGPTCGQNLDLALRSLDSMTNLGADLYKKIVAEKQEQNVVFSPVSISLLLAMLESGAGGATRTQLQTVLARTDENAGKVRNVYEALQYQLQQQTPDVTLKLANGLYTRPTFAVKPQFSDIVQNCFDATQDRCDFQSETENCRRIINEFVANKTQQKIPELFKTGTIEPNSMAVLVNALYLTAQWKNKFVSIPEPRKFFKRGQEEQRVAFMMADNRMSKKESDGVTVVKVPLMGNLSMYIVLPTRNGLPELERNLNGEKLVQLLTVSSEPQRLKLFMPKFSVRTSLTLNRILSEIGISNMFQTNAEFSGITDDNIFVTTMAHEGYIKVNEKGIEAAAATGAVLGLRRAPPVLVVEHPFMFAIKQEDTKALLFLGRINSVDQQ